MLRTRGSAPIESLVVTAGEQNTRAVKVPGTRCREPLIGTLTTSPVVYDDLLAELCSSRGEELTCEELASLLVRPEDQVLAALMDLRTAGLVRYLERDLDLDHPKAEDHWAPAASLQRLRIKAWLDDSAFDLSDDIDVASSGTHNRASGAQLGGASSEARF